MKTIAQFVQQGINTIGELQDALQTSMQLEFATMPPYLCAQWSIDSDPDGVGDLIQNIVVQEMFHFALAGNILIATGGVPNIARPDFLPAYPTQSSSRRYCSTTRGGVAAIISSAAGSLYADRASGIPADRS